MPPVALNREFFLANSNSADARCEVLRGQRNNRANRLSSVTVTSTILRRTSSIPSKKAHFLRRPCDREQSGTSCLIKSSHRSTRQQKNHDKKRITMKMTSQDISQEEDQFRASDADLKAEEKLQTPEHGVLDEVIDRRTATSPHEPLPYQYIPLSMGGNGGSHRPSEASRLLIEYEVSLDDLKRMTNKFYEFAFQDITLDKFIRSHNDPHGDRFAKWIHQKLTGSNIWDEDRRTRDLSPKEIAGDRTTVVHDRTSAHVAAWNSTKRPSSEVGRRFTLEECRVWMRLHFWAIREVGLVEQPPSFADYYVRFIGHFVAVYERSASIFARESFRWSENPKNIEKYITDGRMMKDVLGVPLRHAIRDILPSEIDRDDDWPYAQSSEM